jgi:hypothetical protein
LGLGLNGVNQPGFRDYELHKLPPGENLAQSIRRSHSS